MKKIFWFIILAACTHIVHAQIPSSCIVPSALQTNYDGDVKHLAFQRIINQNSPYKDSIEIPQNYQDTIWQGLAAIFNLTSVIERDSVFDNYCIHHFVSNICHFIYVSVDTAYSWTHPWQSLNITTGLTALDNLLAHYNFTVYSYWSSLNIAKLYTTQNINVTPLCDSIATFAGVNYSEPIPSYGDGDEIIYSKNGNDRFYDFTVGFGDCPSGCTSTHTFKFKVYDDCSVDYLGVFDNITSGDIIPTPINCNITAKIENLRILSDYTIYPNPVEDFINVEANTTYNTDYFITNLYGQILQTGTFSDKIKIMTRNLTCGIYFIKFYNKMNNETTNYKFIKK